MKHLTLALALTFAAALPVAAQIIIDPIPRPLPVPQATVELRAIDIDGAIRDQVAEVTVTQTLFNPGTRPAEAQLLFPVPADAALQDLVLIADGLELRGEVLPREEARRRYREIVSQMIDPALMEYSGYGLVQTSVFPVPAGGESRVVFRYTQVLPREADQVTFAYPFGTARRQQVERLRVALTIRGNVGPVYSPSQDFAIDRQPGRTVARYQAEDVALDRDVRLIYSPAGDGAATATVLSHWPQGAEDGYFLLLASPAIQRQERPPLPKTVVFVLDRSGSMAGVKMEQAKAAMEFVLNNLRDDDLFNIVAYDGRVDVFRDELQRFDAASRGEALAYVDGIRAGGSTNIDEALKTALAMLTRSDDRPAYVIFLTDGLPTAGETRETAIAQNAAGANHAHARVFAFGVGYDLNARLLERLARMSGGTTEYVRPQDDIEAAVATFYGKMSAPVLSDLRLTVDGTNMNRAFPRDLPDLFEGSQLVLAGRYTRAGDVTFHLNGRAGDQTETMRFEARLAAEGTSSNTSFLEPLWANRRVADLLDQIDLQGGNEELVDELVTLATRYGILTPYTSFLAEEDGVFAERQQQVGRVTRALEAMDVVSGASGVAQREMRSHLAAAAQAPAGDVAYVDAQTGERQRVQTVRQVAGRALYRRDTTWVEAGLLDADPAGARVITQLTDAYFELVERLPPDQIALLTQPEDVLVQIGDATYHVIAARRE